MRFDFLLVTILFPSTVLSCVRCFLCAILGLAVVVGLLLAFQKRALATRLLTLVGVLAGLGIIALATPIAGRLFVDSESALEARVYRLETDYNEILSRLETAAPADVESTVSESVLAGDKATEAEKEPEASTSVEGETASSAEVPPTIRLVSLPKPETSTSVSAPEDAVSELYRIAAESAETSFVSDATTIASEEVFGADDLDFMPDPLPTFSTTPQNSENPIFLQIGEEKDRRVIRIEAENHSKLAHEPPTVEYGSMTPIPGRLFATCRHVVYGARRPSDIKAYFPDGSVREAIDVFCDPDPTRDVAILNFGDHFDAIVAEPRDFERDPIRISEAFACVGYRDGRSAANYFKTHVGSVVRRFELLDYVAKASATDRNAFVLQLNATIAEGDSGGAAYDRFGRLSGILFKRNLDANSAFVVPIDDVMNAADEYVKASAAGKTFARYR